MSNKLIIILVYVSICFSSNAQSIKKISENRKEKFTTNYYQKEYSNDTIIIVFDTNQSSTSLIEDVHFKNEYNFRYFKYSRKYPNIDSCVLLEFYHMAGPHQGHEEYLINKRQVVKREYKILFDQEHDFIFWYKNASKLESKTLLFVDQIAWESKKNIIKGVGVQIGVFGSCDDLIEKN